MLFWPAGRSTLIIGISIPRRSWPRSFCLSAIGETINIMTLAAWRWRSGSWSTTATVTIENINYHLEQGRTSRPRSWTAPTRSRCLRWCRRWPSASSSSRCCC